MDQFYRCVVRYLLIPTTLVIALTTYADAQDDFESLSCEWTHVGRALNSDQAVVTWLRHRLDGVATVNHSDTSRVDLSFLRASRDEVLWRVETSGWVEITTPHDPGAGAVAKWLPVAHAVWPRASDMGLECVRLRGGLWSLATATAAKPLTGSDLRNTDIIDNHNGAELVLQFDQQMLARSSTGSLIDNDGADEETAALLVIDGVVVGFGGMSKGSGATMRFDCGHVGREKSIVAVMNAGTPLANISLAIDGIPVDH